jgi:hypothetical protein
MKFESQAARFARLQRYVDAGTFSRGVHRDPERSSEYPFFVVWSDGAESFDSKREAVKTFRFFPSAREYRREEYA